MNYNLNTLAFRSVDVSVQCINLFFVMRNVFKGPFSNDLFPDIKLHLYAFSFPNLRFKKKEKKIAYL